MTRQPVVLACWRNASKNQHCSTTSQIALCPRISKCLCSTSPFCLFFYTKHVFPNLRRSYWLSTTTTTTIKRTKTKCSPLVWCYAASHRVCKSYILKFRRKILVLIQVQCCFWYFVKGSHICVREFRKTLLSCFLRERLTPGIFLGTSHISHKSNFSKKRFCRDSKPFIYMHVKYIKVLLSVKCIIAEG